MNRVQEEYQAFFKNCMDACISYNEEMRQQCVKTVDNLSEISSSQIDMYIENLKGRLYGFKNNGKEGVSLMLESAVEGVKRVKSHIDHHKEGVRVRRNHFKRLMAGVIAVVGLSGLKGVDGTATAFPEINGGGCKQVPLAASKVVSLGKPNVANVDLSDPKIEDVLKAMPVDSLGVKGRYTVGERAITSVLDIVSNINAGKIDPQRLRLSELAQMLICVAAEYKRQLLGGMQTDVSGNNYLAENINVFYLNGCMYGMRGTDVVAILNNEELLEAFKKTKEAFIPQKPMDLAELMTNPKKFELDSFQAGLKGGDGWGDS